MNYKEFLENKIVVAEKFGTSINRDSLPELLLPHQKDITVWAIEGGRRAIFASFGLGKSIMQLTIGYQVIGITNKPFLICMPLGVVGEFKRWCGDNIQAPTFDEAQKWCNENGKGYLEVTGELIAEIPCDDKTFAADWGKMIDYDAIQNN